MICESVVIILLEQGYTYDEILSHISFTITVFLGKVAGRTINPIQEEVSELD